jgi:hypothetical protein
MTASRFERKPASIMRRVWSIIDPGEIPMATQARSRIQTVRSTRPKKDSTEETEKDFLANVMVSVSASLEKMSKEEREQAVAQAERAVAHLQ